MEIVCLIIPTVNDSIDFYKQVARRLTEIDPNIPLHFTRFYPDYQFKEVDATPVSTLEKAHQVASSEGMNFVYLGNVPGHPLENTYYSMLGSNYLHIYSLDQRTPRGLNNSPWRGLAHFALRGRLIFLRQIISFSFCW